MWMCDNMTKKNKENEKIEEENRKKNIMKTSISRRRRWSEKQARAVRELNVKEITLKWSANIFHRQE